MIETRPATIEDAEPISALLMANSPDRGGALHGDHPKNLFADGSVEKTLEEPRLERRRQNLFQNFSGGRQEFVLDCGLVSRSGLSLAVGVVTSPRAPERSPTELPA